MRYDMFLIAHPDREVNVVEAVSRNWSILSWRRKMMGFCNLKP